MDHAARTCLREGERAMTYGELLVASRAIAARLTALRVAPGDRVGIWLPACIEVFPVIFAIWQVGGVVVPLNPLMSRDQVRQIVADAGTRAVVSRAEDVEWLAALAPVVSLTAHPGAAAHLDALGTQALQEAIVPRRDQDDAMLMYTSGSTGRPKGVRQTHRNIAAEVDALIDTLEIVPADIALNTMALFHVSGLQFGTLPLLFRGASVILMPRWNAQAWLDMVQSCRPTLSTLITTMLIDVGGLTQGRPVKLSSLRHCMFGGSRTPPAALDRFITGTGVVPVDIYGTTETNGISITCGPSQPLRAGAAGRGMTQVVDFRLVPPGDSQPLPDGADEIGELWVRGDTVTPGYWNLPDATREKIVDGWLRSGDLMRQDADGYFHYVDRLDDMIVSGGENVYPQGVEAVLASCPLVAQVVVIGTDHPRWVQQVTAIVVPAAGGISAAQIEDFCRKEPRLAGAQRPRRIELVESLPRTGSGKIDRPAVRRLFAAAAEPAPPARRAD